MMRRSLRTVVALAVVLSVSALASACADELTAPEVTATLVNEGAIYPGMLVSLDGSASQDTNSPALPLAFAWEFVEVPAGSHVAFNDPTLAKPSFVPDVTGTYTVRLVVSNGLLTNASPALEIPVDPSCRSQIAIEQLEATPEAPGVDELVTLSATLAGADDCEAANDLSYHWSFRRLPPGSFAQLNDPALVSPSFAPDVPGVYVVRLTLTDDLGHVAMPAELELLASECGAGVPAITDITSAPDAPLAGDTVQLTAAVADPDNADPCGLGQELFYAWDFAQVPTGSLAAFADPTVDAPWFVADLPGTYEPRLIVTDSTGRSSVAFSVPVTVDACGAAAPVVEAVQASPSTPGVGEAVELTAVVTDDDVVTCGLEQALGYQWSLVTVPAGSSASLNGVGLTNPTLIPDRPGTYVIQLVAMDDTGRASTPYLFTLDVTDCGANAPAVTIDDPGTPEVNQAVTLTATVMDADNDPAACDLGQTFTYQWAITAQPQSSLATLNNPASVNPTLTPDVSGTYTLSLTVTDSMGLATTATLDLTVGSCGEAAPVASVDDPGAFDVGQPVPLTATVVDADNDPATCDLGQTFTYHWAVVSQPLGAHPSLNNPWSANPTLVPDVSGIYGLSLVVTDSAGLSSAPALFALTVGSCGELPPAVTIDDPGAFNVGATVQLTATIVDPDNDATQAEDCTTCPADCGACEPVQCGDGVCAAEAGEGCSTCPDDCGPCSATCGDGTCDFPGGEDCSTCPGDCGDCPVDCGDGVCDSALEDCESCPTDCGACAVSCGDGICHTSLGEDCVTCAADCGACPSTCGDGTCEAAAGETCESCAADCGACTAECGDGTCGVGGCAMGQTFTYQWAVTAQPAGSMAALNNATSADPSFTPDQPGSYTLSLTVTDDTGLTGVATRQVDIGACGAAPPVATIDDPGSLSAGAAVALSATVTDADNDPSPGCDMGQTFSYAWSIVAAPAGSTASLNGASLAAPTLFTDASGTYRVRLVVTDSDGLSGAPAERDVVVDACGEAAPTVAIDDPGPVDANQALQLTATVTDADNDPAGCALNQTFTYQWSLTARPAGSAAALDGATLANPTLLPDRTGTYGLWLTVFDDTGRVGTASFDLLVGPCGAFPPTVSVADPGTHDPGEPVALAATVVDSDNGPSCGLGQTFSYAWTLDAQPAGSQATLNNPASATPSFVPDLPGAYTLSVIATDSTGLASAKATQVVTVGDCGTFAPTVSITDPGGPFNVGDAVGLTALVSDPDDVCGADPTKLYHWSLMAVPVGSNPAFYNTATATPTLVPDLPSSAAQPYVVRLDVRDTAGLVGSALLSLETVTGTCGTNPPVITGVAPTAGAIDTLAWAELQVTFSDADNNLGCPGGQTFTYDWKVLDQPLGANATLDNTASTLPGFYAEAPGDYDLAVTVTDSAGLSDTFVTTLTVGTCGAATPQARVAMVQPFSAGPGAAVVAPSPVPPGTAVLLSAAGSVDADDQPPCSRGDALTYQWSWTKTPPGSQATLQGASALEASFIPDLPGAYEVALTVGDGFHTSQAAVFQLQADESQTVGPPAGGAVTYLAGGAGVGFDQPAGVVQVGTDVFVTNQGNDTILRIDTANGNTVSLLSTGAYLNQPRRVVYDSVTDALYVLNGGDDFVVRVARDTGFQTLYIDDTPLAEDLGVYVSGGGVPYLAVAGRFRDRLDIYRLTNAPLSNRVSTQSFGGNLLDPMACEAYQAAGGTHFWASSRELGPTGGARLRHRLGGNDDVYLDDSFEALFIEDLSFEPVDDVVYMAVGGGFDYVAAVDNCGNDDCPRATYATGFDVIGGLFAAGAKDVLVTDAGANAVYRVTAP